MQKYPLQAIACLIAAGGLALLFSAPGSSQSNIAPAPAKGTRLITLGTRAGPIETSGRAQSSNLLIVNGTQYVIDAGDGVTRRLTKFGSNFRAIDTIFITHPHSDHTGGLGALMGVIYDANRTSPVGIYGPPGTAAGVHGLMEFLAVNSEIRISDGTKITPVDKIFTAHDTGAGVIFQDANIKVTAVENTHFHFQPGSPGYGKYKSYSYRFDTPDRSLIFTGDTGPSDAVVALAQGADLLVTEVTGSIEEYKAQQMRSGRWQTLTAEQQAGSIRHMMEEHLVTEEVGKIATRAGVKAVVLTHLPAGANPKEDYLGFAAEVKNQFSGPVMVASDLKEF
jgi:ribonuclease BN (tRNA processing enzyme)